MPLHDMPVEAAVHFHGAFHVYLVALFEQTKVAAL